jgi:hypothetical protein
MLHATHLAALERIDMCPCASTVAIAWNRLSMKVVDCKVC